MFRTLLLVTFIWVPGLARDLTAQRKARAQEPAATGGPIEVTVAGQIGGKQLQASGPGNCRHAPDASIRGVSASLWMVEYTAAHDGGGLRQLNLTLWRPKDESPDQLSLRLETRSGSYRIDTGNPEESKGEASITILPSGPGGRLEIKGKESGGKPVQITIDCPAFAGVEAEGG